MKRIWVVLVALGLVAALGTTGYAVDVKFSGEYYAAGMYLDKTTLTKDAHGDGGPSTAFYYQRLRVQTDFIVTPGLKLVTRLDAMERAWGAQRSEPSAALATDSSGTRAENENIAIDWVYLAYKSPIGEFRAGVMNKGTTGTAFGNNIQPAARIKYIFTTGPITIDATISKLSEASRTAINGVTYADGDNDEYSIEPIFKWKDGRAGINMGYIRQAANRPVNNYKKTYFQFTPYVMAKFGPVRAEAEVSYVTGKEREYDNGTADIKLENLSAYAGVTADIGIFYVGGVLAYVSGEDNSTADKREGGTLTGGRDWQPALIMWNYERTNWAGNLQGYNGTAQDTRMANGYFAQIRGGVKPVAALNIMAAVSYAHVDKPNANLHRDYGYEVDLTATYKITNNLSYMLGAGYLFTGNYYKGTSDANEINNDFLVVNKLTLTF